MFYTGDDQIALGNEVEDLGLKGLNRGKGLPKLTLDCLCSFPWRQTRKPLYGVLAEYLADDFELASIQSLNVILVSVKRAEDGDFRFRPPSHDLLDSCCVKK
jgi:hypothetical protein